MSSNAPSGSGHGSDGVSSKLRGGWNVGAAEFNPKASSFFEPLPTAASFEPLPPPTAALPPQPSAGTTLLDPLLDGHHAAATTTDIDIQEQEDYPQPPELPHLHAQVTVDTEGYLTPPVHSFYYQPGPLLPLQHHLYAWPHSTLGSHGSNGSNFRLDQLLLRHEALRQRLLHRHHATLQVVADTKGLPTEVHGYHSLSPVLQDPLAGGVHYAVQRYKAFSSKHGGRVVELCRLAGFRLQHEQALVGLEAWTRLTHPQLVRLWEAFTTKAFGDDSLVLVFDFYPTAQPLSSVYFQSAAAAGGGGGGGTSALEGKSAAPSTTFNNKSFSSSNSAPSVPSAAAPPAPQSAFVWKKLNESAFWNLTVQLISVVSAVHAAGLACRTMEPTKLLIEPLLDESRHRLRLVGCGLADFLAHHMDPAGYLHTLPLHQQDDLLSMGQLLLCLCCQSVTALQDVPLALQWIEQSFSSDVQQVILYLLGKPGLGKQAMEVAHMILPHVLQELDQSQLDEDTYEEELAREIENARLVRLLLQLGFINERPEYGVDPNWAETGDRYPLKLFRDYVFHQVDANGRPVLDVAHVLECLNKLDAGSLERILLVSRDEQSCLVLSYRELKRCMEVALQELRRS